MIRRSCSASGWLASTSTTATSARSSARSVRSAAKKSAPCVSRTRRLMPAVSTNRQVLPPSSISSSTGSLVVPATESTRTRSAPASLFSRLDLPTFGRPISATRRGPPSASSRSAGRRRQRAEYGVEQVTAAAAVQCADRQRLAEAERPQRVHFRLAGRVVDLVRGQHDRLPATGAAPRRPRRRRR